MHVNIEVKATQELTHHVDDNIMEVKRLTYNIRADVDVIKEGTRRVHDGVNLAKHGAPAIDELQWNQSREKLRTWLTPPNPSLNHNTA